MPERIQSFLPSGYSVYESSIQTMDDSVFALVRGRQGEKFLFVNGPAGKMFQDGRDVAGISLYALTWANAKALRNVFTWLKPTYAGLKASFGAGDRVGLATPGHVRAIKGRGIVPALAQQSIREMERTGRSPEDVINTATWGVFQEGYQGGFLADADHLKTREHVRRTAGAGFTMFTCDPSDHVREGAAALQGNDLKDAFSQLDHWQELMARYVDKTFKAELSALGFGYEGRFGPEELMRAAVKYYRAIEFAGQMCEWLKEEAGGAFDYEISVDETGDPTSPLEHLFIIHELQRQNVEFVSLALRFVGDFQKGIDYIGDVEEFEDTLKAHAAIAKAFGPYKLSLHSGSDKFKIYPVFSKYTDNRYHVKTSGTSYLEAVKVIAEVNPELFRRIHAFALERFGRDRATYHVTTDLGLISDPHSLRDNELPSLLDQNAARQLFHITYGSVLSGQANGEYLFRDEFMKTLAQNEEKHYYFLNEHIGHHIDLLTGREK